MNLEPLPDEERIYRETWHRWEAKIVKTIRSRAIEGVIGCSFEDLLSLSRQTVLYAIRNYKPTEAKFSTFLYTNIHNSIKWSYAVSGLTRQGYRLLLKHKRSGRIEELRNLFHTRGEAELTAAWVGGRRSYDIVRYQERRYKRIPPTLTEGFSGADHLDNGDSDIAVLSPEQRVGVRDKEVPSLKVLLKTTGQHVQDRTDRKILLLLYKGNSEREVARATSLRRPDVEKRIRALRRHVLSAMKEAGV